jgi:hypothetical protein
MDGRWIMPFLGSSFNILPVIRSYPGVFLGLRSSSIMVGISLGVKDLIGFIICSGSSSVLLISILKASFCGSSYGLNTFLNVPPRSGPLF